MRLRPSWLVMATLAAAACGGSGSSSSNNASGPQVPVAALAIGDEHFQGRVVAVLLGPEEAPSVAAQARHLRAEDPADRRIAVRDVRAGNLVVAVVLAEPAVRRIERG